MYNSWRSDHCGVWRNPYKTNLWRESSKGCTELLSHRNLPCEEYFTNTKKANKHTFGGSYCFLRCVRDIELLRSETIGFLRSAMEYATDLLVLHFTFLHPSRTSKSTSIQKLLSSESASWSSETTWLELATVRQKNIGDRLFLQTEFVRIVLILQCVIHPRSWLVSRIPA